MIGGARKESGADIGAKEAGPAFPSKIKLRSTTRNLISLLSNNLKQLMKSHIVGLACVLGHPCLSEDSHN